MRMRLCFLSALFCALFCGCRSAESTEMLEPVSGFEAEKYMGHWYEVARYPHSFERDLHNVTAFYKLDQDGRILVENRGFTPNGKLKVAKGFAFQPEQGIGILRISFFRPFYGEYKIIFLERDYSAAIVTSSSKDYLWILSRNPETSDAKKQAYTDFIRRFGFSVEKLQWQHWRKQL